MGALDEVREFHSNSIKELIRAQTERLETFMATVTEDLDVLATALTALIADDQAKSQKVSDLEKQVSDLEAQVASLDPNAAAELAAAQQKIEELTAEVQAQLPPPVPEALVFTPAGDQ